MDVKIGINLIECASITLVRYLGFNKCTQYITTAGTVCFPTKTNIFNEILFLHFPLLAVLHFLQDSAPIHRFPKTKEWFESN